MHNVPAREPVAVHTCGRAQGCQWVCHSSSSSNTQGTHSLTVLGAKRAVGEDTAAACFAAFFAAARLAVTSCCSVRWSSGMTTNAVLGAARVLSISQSGSTCSASGEERKTVREVKRAKRDEQVCMSQVQPTLGPTESTKCASTGMTWLWLGSRLLSCNTCSETHN